jgi:hypothetical protein
MTEPTNSVDQDTNISDRGVQNILDGVKGIAVPSNLMPIVCLSDEAFPILTFPVHIDDSVKAAVGELPIAAGSVGGKGRIICISHINYLNKRHLMQGNTARFLLNALDWCTHGKGHKSQVLALGFNDQERAIVSEAMASLGIFGEFRSTPDGDIKGFGSVFLPSEVDFRGESSYQHLRDFVVREGGGIMVFYSGAIQGGLSIPVNSLLIEFGLSFTFVTANPELESCEILNVARHSGNSEIVLSRLIAKLQALLVAQPVKYIELDSLVTILRYHIMACNRGHDSELKEVYETCWNFMKKTDFKNDSGFCPVVSHGIIFVLILDICGKLPETEVKPFPNIDSFPGQTGAVQLENFQMTLTIQNGTWTSTGLWLPAGSVGEIECSEPRPNLHVQIGSQHESLFGNLGPWKRWPSTVFVIPLIENVTKVVTPFGGIVYVAVHSGEEETEKVDILFKGFCQHPCFHYGDPSVWESTKNLEVPWGELCLENVVFTLPTTELKKIPDFGVVQKKFKDIVDGICRYVSWMPAQPYRFVFDVELADDSPSCGYPLVFPVEDIEGILMSFDAPTPQLFSAVTLMTIVSIREGCFDQVTESGIATVATSVIFQELFPGFDPLEFEGIELPPMFLELWEIQKHCNPDIIPATLAKFQDPEAPVSDVPEDTWISFVREICRIGKMDFTGLLERSRPIPLNVSVSLQGLPAYQFFSATR